MVCLNRRLETGNYWISGTNPKALHIAELDAVCIMIKANDIHSMGNCLTRGQDDRGRPTSARSCKDAPKRDYEGKERQDDSKFEHPPAHMKKR